MIRFACPGCSAVFSVADDKAGKTSKCPKCQSLFEIPAAPVAKKARTKESVAIEPCPKCQTTLTVDRADLGSEVECPTCERVFVARKAKARKAESDWEVVEDEPEERPRRASRRNASDEDPDDDENDESSRGPARSTKKKKLRGKRDKKGKQSGLILAVGIVSIVFALAASVIAGIDSDKVSAASNRLAQSADGLRGNIPKELQVARSQTQTAILFYQVAIYTTFVSSILYIVGGIGLILQQQWGRMCVLAAIGLSALIVLCMFIYLILLLTVTVNGKSPPFPMKDVLNFLLRLIVHLVPAIFGLIVLLNSFHCRHLRSGF